MQNINTDKIQPIDYFNLLKDNVKESTINDIKMVNNTIVEKIEAAKKLNQVVLVNDLLFTYEVTQKEILAITHGFNKYMTKDILQEFIDKVEPKNSVKVIDLEKYPRVIPETNSKDIEIAQSLNIFDKYVVIFTDLADSVKKSNLDEKFIEANRDPIVLGYFYNDKYKQRYDRYYVITDWEDEYCDLTFDNMIRKMATMKMKNNNSENIGKIDVDSIKNYVDDNMAKLYGNIIRYDKKEIEQKDNLINKLKNFFKKG